MLKINGNLDKYRRCFSAASIGIGTVAAAMPDAYAKIGFAIALALSNIAIYIKSEQKGGERERKD